MTSILFSEPLNLDLLEPVDTAFQMIGSTMAFLSLVGIGVYGCYQLWMVSEIVNIDNSDILSLFLTCFCFVAN